MKKIIYAGTPDFAVPALEALIAHQNDSYQIVAVYTQPDRKAGRGRKLQASAVKKCAVANQLPVVQPASFNSPATIAELQNYNADLIIVAAYGLMLPEEVLNAPRYGCVNLHASILPRWRGAAPIQRAIMAGDSRSGISLMQMDQGLDTGDILATTTTAISAADNGQSLHDKLAKLSAKLLLQHLPQLLSGQIKPSKQDSQLATYAHKLQKEDGKLDFSRSAAELALQVRALNPWPVCHAQLNATTVRIWNARALHALCPETPLISENFGKIAKFSNDSLDIICAQGLLRVEQLQLPAGKIISGRDFLNAQQQPDLQFD